MISEKISFMGVGQAGGNVVTELEKFNFNCFYVNTSLEDLDTIETDKKNKYHLKGTKGMGKDRNLATECILSNNNAENICYAMYEQYSMSDIIFIVYSLSGGTGGSMGSILAVQMADSFPDKIVNVVAILPKDNEDIGLQANAIESLQQLKEIKESGAITQLHLLDNNSREDIFSINKDFAVCFERFINFNQIDKTGNLDEEEREKLLMQQGMGVFLDFYEDDFGNGIAKTTDNSIYAEWLRNPKLNGIILNKKQNTDINHELIKEVVGSATFTHKTVWDANSNVIFTTGMDFNDNVLTKMKINANNLLEKKKAFEENEKKSIEKDVEFDTSAIISNINKKKTSPTQTNVSQRRRGENKGSSVLDKFRKM